MILFTNAGVAIIFLAPSELWRHGNMETCTEWKGNAYSIAVWTIKFQEFFSNPVNSEKMEKMSKKALSSIFGKTKQYRLYVYSQVIYKCGS